MGCHDRAEHGRSPAVPLLNSDAFEAEEEAGAHDALRRPGAMPIG
jgi:hypothetical protein